MNSYEWDSGKGYDEWLYMPKWKKVVYYIVACLIPVIGSIESINF